MFQSKLLELYQELTKRERRLFKKWLYSPLHNEHEDVQKLFEFVANRHSWTAVTLQKERVWEYLYAKQQYDDNRLRYIMSLALEVLTNFVGYNQAIKDDFVQQKNKIEALKAKKLHKQIKKPIQKAENILKDNYQNAQFHYRKYQLEELKFELEGTTDRTRSTNIAVIAAQTTLFFMVTTLRYACIALSHKNIKNTDYDFDLLDMVLNKIKQDQKYQSHAVLMLYYHGYYTLQGKEDNFLALKNYLHNFTLPIEDRERREALLMGINYGIKQLNTGDSHYIRETFEWYRVGLKRDLLLEQGQLSLFAYSNIIALGLNLKEFEWIEQFIKQYTLHLKAANRANYQHYNLAKLSFAKGDLQQAMQSLIQAEYDDLLLNIESKVLLLKIYYQEDYYDALDALLDSFRIFLGRKKVLSYHKENYMNLISMTRRLLNLNGGKDAIKKLKKKIEQTQPLTEKKWLLEQLG